MAPSHCPICKREVVPRAKNPSFPFCSRRCRAVDLGKWLGEEYRVPQQHAEEQEDELSETPGADRSPGGDPREDA
jgi:uncharacterized protein